MRERVHVFNYEGVLRQRVFPYGCYVFTDFDRTTPEQMRGVQAFYDYLGTLGPGVRRINHPGRSLQRYDLLRTLFERGINDFDVYRVTEEREPARYPAFLRAENSHKGALSEPLHDRRQLEVALAKLERRGHRREDLLIVEFCDVRDEQGLIRKYGAFRVGETILPRHLFISKDWVAKNTDAAAVDPVIPLEERVREEVRYIDENPHADQLRAAFDIAQIRYGRIDYSVKDGRIRVWEINTNPAIADRRSLDGGPRHRLVQEPGLRRLAEAILALDEGLTMAGRFDVDPTIGERLAATAAPT
jgi:hypothetical protein